MPKILIVTLTPGSIFDDFCLPIFSIFAVHFGDENNKNHIEIALPNFDFAKIAQILPRLQRLPNILR
jgi:hypothetical protein